MKQLLTELFCAIAFLVVYVATVIGAYWCGYAKGKGEELSSRILK